MGRWASLSFAPFDRIVLTVAATDLSPAWWEQLHPNGRLLLPFRIGGILTQKVAAFERVGGLLETVAVREGFFMMLRGSLAQPQTGVNLGDETGLMVWSDELRPSIRRSGTDSSPARTRIGRPASASTAARSGAASNSGWVCASRRWSSSARVASSTMPTCAGGCAGPDLLWSAHNARAARRGRVGARDALRCPAAERSIRRGGATLRDPGARRRRCRHAGRSPRRARPGVGRGWPSNRRPA